MNKKLIILASLTILTSCTKDWKCTLETSTPYNNSTYTVSFRGTKKEMKEYEESQTKQNADVTTIMKCQ
jgi:hypothetical protein